MALPALLDVLARDTTVRRVLESVGREQLVDVAGATGSRAPLLALLACQGDQGTPCSRSPPPGARPRTWPRP